MSVLATARNTLLTLVDKGILVPIEAPARRSQGRPAQVYKCPAILDIVRE